MIGRRDLRHTRHARTRRWPVLACASLLLPLASERGAAVPPAGPAVTPAPVHKTMPALFGVGAQPCRAFVDVAGEATSREIALSGAMFSWAQGWFSARNLIGHERNPLVVGGTLSAEQLKALLVSECKDHPDEAIYLAVDDLYERLAKKRQ